MPALSLSFVLKLTPTGKYTHTHTFQNPTMWLNILVCFCVCVSVLSVCVCYVWCICVCVCCAVFPMWYVVFTVCGLVCFAFCLTLRAVCVQCVEWYLVGCLVLRKACCLVLDACMMRDTCRKFCFLCAAQRVARFVWFVVRSCVLSVFSRVQHATCSRLFVASR